jgi:hypothetical protein
MSSLRSAVNTPLMLKGLNEKTLGELPEEWVMA